MSPDEDDDSRVKKWIHAAVKEAYRDLKNGHGSKERFVEEIQNNLRNTASNYGIRSYWIFSIQLRECNNNGNEDRGFEKTMARFLPNNRMGVYPYNLSAGTVLMESIMHEMRKYSLILELNLSYMKQDGSEKRTEERYVLNLY